MYNANLADRVACVPLPFPCQMVDSTAAKNIGHNLRTHRGHRDTKAAADDTFYLTEHPRTLRCRRGALLGDFLSRLLCAGGLVSATTVPSHWLTS